MPIHPPATASASITPRVAATRLVILERAVLVGTVDPHDDRPVPLAEAAAGAVEASARLAHGGFHVAIASHQPAVARGLLEMATVNGQNRRLSRQLEEAGGRIDAIAICPHAADAGCDCRMPRPGMLTDLMTRFSVGAGCTALIAASRAGVEAGLAAGCATLWIDSPAAAVGAGTAPAGRDDGTVAIAPEADGVLRISSLAEAAEHLLGHRANDPCTARDTALDPRQAGESAPAIQPGQPDPPR